MSEPQHCRDCHTHATSDRTMLPPLDALPCPGIRPEPQADIAAQTARLNRMAEWESGKMAQAPAQGERAGCSYGHADGMHENYCEGPAPAANPVHALNCGDKDCAANGQLVHGHAVPLQSSSAAMEVMRTWEKDCGCDVDFVCWMHESPNAHKRDTRTRMEILCAAEKEAK